jgi:hypothetical protein
MKNPRAEKDAIPAGGPTLRLKTKPNPTEFAEAYLEGIRQNGTSGTFLTTYRNGRPVLIREVNHLQ